MEVVEDPPYNAVYEELIAIGQNNDAAVTASCPKIVTSVNFGETFLPSELFSVSTYFDWFPAFQCSQITPLIWPEQVWCAFVSLLSW